MPHRKSHTAKASSRGSKAPIAKRKGRLVDRVAHGALLAIGISGLQLPPDDTRTPKRLFDHRVVDSLQPPLTHFRE